MFKLFVLFAYCKELNERERADHANTKYEQLRSLVTQLENRNSELEQKFAEVRCLFFYLINLFKKC